MNLWLLFVLSKICMMGILLNRIVFINGVCFNMFLILRWVFVIKDYINM